MVAPAFSQPVFHSQSIFRTILDALARPGRVWPISKGVAGPGRLSAGAAAVALTLCDHDTPVWLDALLSQSCEVAQWFRFHCGCPIVTETCAASFVFAADSSGLPPFDAFNPGTADYPDRSTTIVLQVETLQSGMELTLMGPGIQGRTTFRAKALPPDFSDRLARNRILFPRGNDLLLVTESDVLGLPRSVRVVEH